MAEPRTFEQAKGVIAEQREQIVQEINARLAAEKERDAFRKERDLLRETAGTLSDKLETMRKTQNTQGPAISEIVPPVTPEQQKNIDKSDFILRGLRGQPPKQDPVTSAPTSSESAIKEAEWAEEKRNALINHDRIVGEKNQEIDNLRNIIQDAKRIINHWQSMAGARANATFNNNTEKQQMIDQYQMELKDWNAHVWRLNTDIGKLMGERDTLTKKLKAKEEECEDYKNKWYYESGKLRSANKLVKENFDSAVEQRDRRMEVEQREERNNAQFEREIQELKEEITKRNTADNQRIAKEPSQIRPTPQNPRRSSPVSSKVAKPTTKAYALENIELRDRGWNVDLRSNPLKPTTTMKSREKESSTVESTAGTPAKSNKRKREVEEEIAWDNPPASKLLKGAGWACAVGLIGMAGERGLLW